MRNMFMPLTEQQVPKSGDGLKNVVKWEKLEHGIICKLRSGNTITYTTTEDDLHEAAPIVKAWKDEEQSAAGLCMHAMF